MQAMQLTEHSQKMSTKRPVVSKVNEGPRRRHNKNGGRKKTAKRIAYERIVVRSLLPASFVTSTSRVVQYRHKEKCGTILNLISAIRHLVDQYYNHFLLNILILQVIYNNQ